MHRFEPRGQLSEVNGGVRRQLGRDPRAARRHRCGRGHDGSGGARRRDVYRCGERAESFSIRPRPSVGPGGGALHASRRARAARRQESPPFVRLSTARRVARAAALIEAQRATE